jgi:hypothetical protein
MREWRFVGLIAVVLSAALVNANGCQKASGTTTVHGHISYQGQPLNGSIVTFLPAAGRSVTANAPQGDYSTELKPGEYTVIVSVGIEYPKGFKEGDPIPPPKLILPDKYTTQANSTLKTTVKAGQTDPIDFDLK